MYAHILEIALAVRSKIDVIPTDAFWHVPKRAITGISDDSGTFDWVLVKPYSQGRNYSHTSIVVLEYDAKTTTELVTSGSGQSNPVVLTVGLHDTPSTVDNFPKYLASKYANQLQPAKSLETASYKGLLQRLFAMMIRSHCRKLPFRTSAVSPIK